MTETLTPLQEKWIETFGDKPKGRKLFLSKLRFVDQPFDSLCAGMRKYGNRDIWESRMRGRWVDIVTGTTDGPSLTDHYECDGPFFFIVPKWSEENLPNVRPGTLYKLCGCLVELD